MIIFPFVKESLIIVFDKFHFNSFSRYKFMNIFFCSILFWKYFKLVQRRFPNHCFRLTPGNADWSYPDWLRWRRKTSLQRAILPLGYSMQCYDVTMTIKNRYGCFEWLMLSTPICVTPNELINRYFIIDV